MKILFLLLPLFSFAQSNHQHAYSLTWYDFKGEPKTELASVNTSLGWDYEIDDSVISHVVCHADIHPELSYTNTKDPYVLQHENIHYLITVYFAKQSNSLIKFRMLYSIKDFDSLTKRIEDEWRETQDKYDNETNHSQNYDAQRHWNKWVQEKLK